MVASWFWPIYFQIVNRLSGHLKRPCSPIVWHPGCYIVCYEEASFLTAAKQILQPCLPSCINWLSNFVSTGPLQNNADYRIWSLRCVLINTTNFNEKVDLSNQCFWWCYIRVHLVMIMFWWRQVGLFCQALDNHKVPPNCLGCDMEPQVTPVNDMNAFYRSWPKLKCCRYLREWRKNFGRWSSRNSRKRNCQLKGTRTSQVPVSDFEVPISSGWLFAYEVTIASLQYFHNSFNLLFAWTCKIHDNVELMLTFLQRLQTVLIIIDWTILLDSISCAL